MRECQGLLRTLEGLSVDESERPLADVRVVGCGHLTASEAKAGLEAACVHDIDGADGKTDVEGKVRSA